MPRPHRSLTRRWPAGSDGARRAREVRDDLVAETAIDGAFVQRHGPFRHYRRVVDVAADGSVVERTEYRLALPWFGWLLSLPVRHALRHRPPAGASSPWWAPPDRLDERQVRTLALLASATMTAAFANTLFTQTANFAADDFGVGAAGQGLGGAIVRLGVVIALPFAVVADRIGRRRTIVLLSWLTPLCCALGAFAPGFWVLVASQTVARPLGLALSLIAAIAAAEDMPRNSRAYALSVLAMAAGLGAGVAVVLLRHLLETTRFQTVHRIAPPMDRQRLGLVAGVALMSNLFVAPASFFQNRYLDDIRGYTGGGITLFTLATGTPASLGLILGGRLADTVGRRRLIAWCSPLSTACLVAGYFTEGALMWLVVLLGGFTAAMTFPAFAVYRAELFPTGSRGAANGIVTASALVAGSLGILAVGVLHDRGYGFGGLIAVVALGQLVAAFAAWRWYPETAHLELEEINPDDPVIT